jgi:hypothetical protein
MCVNKGVDWKTILGWVGQSSFKIMARYYGLNDKYQEEKMKSQCLRYNPVEQVNGESPSENVFYKLLFDYL